MSSVRRDSAGRGLSVLVSLLVLTQLGLYAQIDAASLGRRRQHGDDLMFVRQSEDRMIKVAPGQNVVLECEAAGTPSPTIHWLHNGRRIIQGDDRDVLNDEAAYQRPATLTGSRTVMFGTTKSRLYIDCISPVDAGDYTCVAETPTKRIASTTTVRVAASHAGHRSLRNKVLKRRDSTGRSSGMCANDRSTERAARVYMWSVNLLTSEGSDVQLFCRTTGSQQKTVSWYNRRDQLITSDQPQFKVLPSGDLLIRDVTWIENMGSYRCVVGTGDDSDQHETFLYPVKAEE